MRKNLIAGNWKMFHTPAETTIFFTEFLKLSLNPERDVAFFPPFISLQSALAAAGTKLIIGAQNLHWADSGAYTGEVSAPMLKSIGCTHVLIGHSERRTLFHETDTEINQKVLAALKAELTPVLCIGETLTEREAGRTFTVLKSQIEAALLGVWKTQLPKIVLAYEPVWAIGTGKTATPEMAQEAHNFIRWFIDRLYGTGASLDQIILYGGSVKPDSAPALLKQPDIDGFLVGGASLKPDVFAKIVNA